MAYFYFSGYQFITLSLNKVARLRDQLMDLSAAHGLRGTILLSLEGINLFLAGEKAAAKSWITAFHAIPEFSDVVLQHSMSQHMPFQKLKVRIKKEIITLGEEGVSPVRQRAPYLEPEALRKWYQSGKAFVMLDTRNDYEFDKGTFDGAMHLAIQQFSDFPKALCNLPDSVKAKPVVTFCTGGIRCEKAAVYMRAQGFGQVWQLKGGILNYFKKCQQAYFSGDCFVFDARAALDSNLNPVLCNRDDEGGIPAKDMQEL